MTVTVFENEPKTELLNTSGGTEVTTHLPGEQSRETPAASLL